MRRRGGISLGNTDVGNISLYMHYSLGAGGGPSALYLGFLTDYNAHTKSEYRLGLFELPLPQSPGERLDDLQQYGYTVRTSDSTICRYRRLAGVRGISERSVTSSPT